MNVLKSIFISNYMMLAMGISGYAGWMLYQGADPMAWGGVLLTAGPIILVISRLMMFQNAPRTSAHFPVLGVLGVIGTALAIWAWVNNPTSILAPTLATIGLVGFLLYAYWFSTFGRKPSTKIKVGAQLPKFAVKNVEGAVVSSDELTEGRAILMFYRGNWCPLCMAQVKELAKRYQDISALGVRVALISPQPHKNTISLAKKFGVNFEFLTDKGNAAARTLGIGNPHGLPMGMQMMGYDSETVLPTVIITDETGKVVWTDETDNYRVRPEPDVYLAVLRENHLVGDAA